MTKADDGPAAIVEPPTTIAAGGALPAWEFIWPGSFAAGEFAGGLLTAEGGFIWAGGLFAAGEFAGGLLTIAGV